MSIRLTPHDSNRTIDIPSPAEEEGGVCERNSLVMCHKYMDIGIEDYLYSGNWCFIEWPEKIPNCIPDQHSTITIELLPVSLVYLIVSILAFIVLSLDN